MCSSHLLQAFHGISCTVVGFKLVLVLQTVSSLDLSQAWIVDTNLGMISTSVTLSEPCSSSSSLRALVKVTWEVAVASLSRSSRR